MNRRCKGSGTIDPALSGVAEMLLIPLYNLGDGIAVPGRHHRRREGRGARVADGTRFRPGQEDPDGRVEEGRLISMALCGQDPAQEAG